MSEELRMLFLEHERELDTALTVLAAICGRADVDGISNGLPTAAFDALSNLAEWYRKESA